MPDVVAIDFESRASELRFVRRRLHARLAEHSIIGSEAEAIIALVNELLMVPMAIHAGTLNVTVELDTDVARISILAGEDGAEARPQRDPLNAIAFALINGLAASRGLSSHLGAKYIWAERSLTDASTDL